MTSANSSVTVWALPGVNGANHMCISSRVKLTPSIKLAGTRGSFEYPSKVFISEGVAETCLKISFSSLIFTKWTKTDYYFLLYLKLLTIDRKHYQQ